MKHKITICMAVHNQLELTKNAYFNIRKLYPDVEISISSDKWTGSENDYATWFEELRNIDGSNFIGTWFTKDNTSFSENWNNTIKNATNDKVVLVHNDMILGANFLENIEKHLKRKMLLGYLTIEPPIFEDHNRPGKVIYDYGRDFNSFDFQKFNEKVKEIQLVPAQIEDGTFSFLAVYKSDILDIGGFDGKTFNPAFCEDTDFILRCRLSGYKIININTAISYHFVSKTSRFSNEFKDISQQMNRNSVLDFVRKWSFDVLEAETYPVEIIKRYNVAFIVNDCNESTLGCLEPWSDDIYIDIDPINYITKEQKNTSFNLKDRIFYNQDKKLAYENYDIIIEFSFAEITNDKLNFIHRLQQIIRTSGEVGKMKYDIFNITINKMENLALDMIKC